MKILKLTKGKETLVDDEDYKNLSKWKWSLTCKQYGVRREKGKMILIHRQILGLPKGNIDHINGNGLDNRKENLRVCTQSQNTKNGSAHKDSSSKYKGVFWNKAGRGRWRTRLMSEGKIVFDKQFRNEIDAALAYNEAAKKHHGAFARLNIIN